MALYPIKVLLDKDRNVFIPFLPADAIPINGTDETVTQALANRYTKTEVDKIIEELGTLQVLRGRVATRADLDNIQNPKAGDTYIVGTSTTNNSEWMWVGDAWEELGPMIELEDYYTKEEVYNKTETYSKVETEIRIDEKIAEIPAPDMSNYYKKSETYNKTEADNKIDEKIAAIPANVLLHYKGHVNSVDDLPSTGQESGVVIGTPVNINGTVKNKLALTSTPTSFVTTLNNKANELGMPYYIGYTGKGACNFGIFFKDIDSIIGISCANIYETGIGYRYPMFVKVKATEDNPIKIVSYGNEAAVYIACMDISNNSKLYRGYAYNGRGYTLTKDAIISFESTLSTTRASGSLVSNTGATFKYSAITTYWDVEKDTLKDFGDNNKSAYHAYDTTKVYYTNDGMKFLSFNLDTYTATIVQNDPSPLAIENSMYTVGDNYDIYVCDNRPHWNLWSKADLENYYNKQEVDAKFNDIELFKFPNATIIGEPTINNGQISDFTSQDYLQFPFIVDFRGRPFTINAAITTGDNVESQENIFDSLFGFAFAIQNSHFVLAMSSNGTSWDIGAIVGTYEVLPNTTYYIKISWDGTRYSLSYSLDKQEYIDDIVEESELSLYPKQVVIGVGDLSTANPKVFSGIINMNYCDLVISDKLVWSGMDSVGIASRADVSLSNLDEAGKQVIRDVAKEELPDMSDYYNRSETDNKIDEKINAIPIIDLLHYKGHLNSVEELPSTGQPSGDAVLPTYVMTQDDINHLCVTTDNINNVRSLQSYSGMQYVVGGKDTNNTIHGVASNYIDIFDKIYVQSYTGFYKSVYVAIHVNASEDKPVKVFRNNSSGGFNFNVYFDDDTKEGINSSSKTFTKPLWMVIGSALDSATYFCGNVTNPLKFDHPVNSNLAYISTGFTNSKLNTIALLSIDNYKYNVGMNFARFNDLGNIELFTNEPSPLCVENNAYTVGDNYDIYVCDDRPRWNLWSGPNKYLADYTEYADSSVPTEDNQIANKRYVDDVIRESITEVLGGEY